MPNSIRSRWHLDRCWCHYTCTRSSSFITQQTSQIRCCQACSSFFRLGEFSFEPCTAPFRVSLSSLLLREASAPEASFSQSMFHEASFADVQTSDPSRSLLPRASPQVNSLQATQFARLAFLGPSQGFADTEFRNVRPTRSVASRRLTVRTLCMPLSVPT